MTSKELLLGLRYAIRIKTMGFADYQLERTIASNLKLTLTTMFMIGRRYGVRLIMIEPNGRYSYVKDSRRAIKQIIAKAYEDIDNENKEKSRTGNQWITVGFEPQIERLLEYCNRLGYKLSWGYKGFDYDKKIFYSK